MRATNACDGRGFGELDDRTRGCIIAPGEEGTCGRGVASPAWRSWSSRTRRGSPTSSSVASRAEGFEVRVAGDGDDRRASWRSSREVDLVVLDRMLPGRDGIEVLRGDPAGAAGAAGDPADGEGRGRRPGRGARPRRHRLRHQAVRLRGAAGANPGPPALRRRWSRDDPRRPLGSGSTCSARGDPARRDRSAARARGRRCSPPDAATTAGSARARRSSPRSGATSTTPAPTWSRSTSATCGASSPCRAPRRRSRPCARSATGCGSRGEGRWGGSACAAGWRSQSGRSSSSPSPSSSSPSAPRCPTRPTVIQREEGHEHEGYRRRLARRARRVPRSRRSSDAQSDVEKTFLLVGGSDPGRGAPRRLPARRPHRLAAAAFRADREPRSTPAT